MRMGAMVGLPVAEQILEEGDLQWSNIAIVIQHFYEKIDVGWHIEEHEVAESMDDRRRRRRRESGIPIVE